MSHELSAPNALRFALAGRAHLTLESAKSGAHFTFQISRATDKVTNKPAEPAVWFVSLLVDGSADDGTFRYVGLIGSDQSFRLTKKSAVSEEAPSVKAFKFFWSHLKAGAIAPNLIVRHEGRCCRCGRTLTHPESIDTGIGPECRAKMGLAS